MIFCNLLGRVTHTPLPTPTELGVPWYLCSFLITWIPYFGKRDMHIPSIPGICYHWQLQKQPLFYAFLGNPSQTMPPIPPFRRHAAPYAIECVCVGGGGGSHALSGVCLWTFEPFIQPLHLGQSELGNSSRKPIGSGWRKVKSALGGGGGSYQFTCGTWISWKIFNHAKQPTKFSS